MENKTASLHKTEAEQFILIGSGIRPANTFHEVVENKSSETFLSIFSSVENNFPTKMVFARPQEVQLLTSTLSII